MSVIVVEGALPGPAISNEATRERARRGLRTAHRRCLARVARLTETIPT